MRFYWTKPTQYLSLSVHTEVKQPSLNAECSEAMIRENRQLVTDEPVEF